MGIIELLFEKHEEQADELDNIKREVSRESDRGSEKREKSAPPQASQMDNLELKMIKVANEVENLKAAMTESTEKILENISKLSKDTKILADQIGDVPKNTMTEMRKIKKVQPVTYENVKQVVGQNIKASSLDRIDTDIIKTIKESGRINSRDLLEKTRINKVCSKNTLYIHLQRLEERSLIIKKRSGHEIIYSINEEERTGSPTMVEIQLQPEGKPGSEGQQPKEPVMGPKEPAMGTKEPAMGTKPEGTKSVVIEAKPVEVKATTP